MSEHPTFKPADKTKMAKARIVRYKQTEGAPFEFTFDDGSILAVSVTLDSVVTILDEKGEQSMLPNGVPVYQPNIGIHTQIIPKSKTVLVEKPKEPPESKSPPTGVPA